MDSPLPTWQTGKIDAFAPVYGRRCFSRQVPINRNARNGIGIPTCRDAPMRCGEKPHLPGLGTMRFGLECLINSKIYYKCLFEKLS